jgi:hypothetical protein
MNNLLLDNRTKSAGNKIYFAKVIRFYPSSNTVDVVTIDNNISLTSCNIVCSMPAGFSYGTRYFPTHDDENSEVEYVNSSGDIYCVATFLDGDFNNAAVLGFIFPLQTTLSISEYGLYIFRHESDVMWMVRGDGTVQMYHPSGGVIKIGEDDSNELTDDRETGGIYPAKVDGLYVQRPEDYNAQKTSNFYINWHAGQKVTLNSDGEIILQTRDAATTLTMTPDGKVTIETTEEINAITKNVNVRATGDVAVESAGAVNVSSDENTQINVGGNLIAQVDGNAFVSAPSGSANINAPSVYITTDQLTMNGVVGYTGTIHEHSGGSTIKAEKGIVHL